MGDRVAALSEQLAGVHQGLAEWLAELRENVASGAAAPARRPGDLLSHCTAFCAAVQTHHRGEDAQLLPALRTAAPQLAPVIDALIEDHGLVAGILRRIGELLAGYQPSSGPDTLIRELDGLTAILASHFSYEERRLATALDGLGQQTWTADVFTLSRTTENHGSHRPG